MRATSMAIALAATLALPTLATAQSGLPSQPYPSNTTDNAGNPPGAYTAQGKVTNRGPRVTTGQGYNGGMAGPTPMRTYRGHRRSHRTIER